MPQPWVPPIHDRIVELPADKLFTLSVAPGDTFDVKLLEGGPLYWSHSLSDPVSPDDYADVLTSIDQVHTLNHPAQFLAPDGAKFDVIRPEVVNETPPDPPPFPEPNPSVTPPTDGNGTA